MKLTATQHEETVTIETGKEGLTLEEMLEILERLLRGMGYSVNQGSLEIKDDE